MKCPNCNRYDCYCTWDEMLEAMKIHKRRQAEFRRRIKQPTVIEEEQDRQRKGHSHVRI